MIAAAAAAVSLVLGCAHAPPVTGDHARGAPTDASYPEQNCGIYNTVDCRPSAD